MKDIDGNEVEVGDLVKVLHIDQDLLNNGLADDERPLHAAMLNNDYEIDGIVCDGTKVSVTVEWEFPDYIMIGGLYMRSNEFRLVKKKGGEGDK